jgi:hypothetical protein
MPSTLRLGKAGGVPGGTVPESNDQVDKKRENETAARSMS